MMLMRAASRESDADEFHDALDHLEEEVEEYEHETTADEDVAAAAIEDHNDPALLQNNPSEEELPINNITSTAAEEKEGTKPYPPQPPTREVTEESWQSADSVSNSVQREGSTEERIPLETLTQPSGDLLEIPTVSLFDALSGSGSEELENAELKHTLWNSLGKSSAEIDNIETQDTDGKHGEQSIDNDEKIIQGSFQDETTDRESHTDRLTSEKNDDTAINNDAEEGEQEQSEKPLVEGGADVLQTYVPDALESDVNEECEDTGNTVSEEEEEEGQVSNNGVSEAAEEEEQKRMEGAEGKVEEDAEEEATNATLEVSTTESSSIDIDTPTKELQALQLDEEKTIVDEPSEQLPEEGKLAEKESDGDLTRTPGKGLTENAVQEQIVTDGDYTTPRKIDCGEMCDIGSPLEALFLFCQGGRSGLDIDTKEDGLAIPLRTSMFTDADPKVPAPLSPIEDQKHDYDSDSSEDSSVDSTGRFQMINKDTGIIHDVRKVMRDINDKGSSDAIDTQYSILPDRETLEYHQRLSTGSNEMKEIATNSFDESVSTSSHRSTSTSGSPTSSARKKASELSEKLKRGVASLKSSSKKHHRKRILSSEELPGNAVHVRSSKAKTAQMLLASSSSQETPSLQTTDSSFNPMLLVKTIQAHDGPAWCAAFSQDGRFLATGGEDGNVAIWAVSPRSKTLHPKGVPTRGQEKQNEDQVPPLSFIGLGPELATNLEIISSEPVQRYRDHTADVIDLSWSKFYHLSSHGMTIAFCLNKFPHQLCFFREYEQVIQISY